MFRELRVESQYHRSKEYYMGALLACNYCRILAETNASMKR
jgi:hypothetical protein